MIHTCTLHNPFKSNHKKRAYFYFKILPKDGSKERGVKGGNFIYIMGEKGGGREGVKGNVIVTMGLVIIVISSIYRGAKLITIIAMCI